MPVNSLFRQTDSLRRCSIAKPVSRWRKLPNELQRQLVVKGKAPAMETGLKRRIESHVGTWRLLFSRWMTRLLYHRPSGWIKWSWYFERSCVKASQSGRPRVSFWQSAARRRWLARLGLPGLSLLLRWIQSSYSIRTKLKERHIAEW